MPFLVILSQQLAIVVGLHIVGDYERNRIACRAFSAYDKAPTQLFPSRKGWIRSIPAWKPLMSSRKCFERGLYTFGEI